MAILETIKGPADVKRLPADQLPLLAEEIRERIIRACADNGGHIGPNLGVVELTLAMHRVFTTPDDSFTFDVAHQGYVHKLLTGRNGPEFDKIRLTGGLNGFLKRDESEHDSFGAGHAGTALSAAVGMAAGRDLRNGSEHVVAVIGDAALTCGVTFEALNNIKTHCKRLIIVLNDNERSIDKNVGAIPDYLSQLITNPVYNRANNDLENFLKGVPGGDRLIKLGSRIKQETKDFVTGQASLFEKFGVRYIGPVDGHNLEMLTRYFEFCKSHDGPVLLHVKTIKGKGCEVAIKHPEKFHGCSPFIVETGEAKTSTKPGTPPNWQDVFGKTLEKYARKDPRIVGITGAMPSGTSLSVLRDRLPGQYFDVGIAEEHGVIFAAGLATKGLKPVVAIYSTFLQRAFDMIMHDVCLQNLDVTFCMDRAGLSPNDGATHHGLFDIAYLRCLPRTVIMQPKDEDELADMMHTAITHNGPAFVRYPRGAAVGVTIKPEPVLLPLGKAEVLKAGSEIQIWALGPWCADAAKLAEQLEAAHPGVKVGVVNARFAKPLDTELLAAQAKTAKLIVTMEEHTIHGGFGSAVLEALAELGEAKPLVRIGWPDKFIHHGSSVAGLRADNGLSPEAIFAKVDARFKALV